MTDPSLSTRIDLASVVIYEYRQQEPDRDHPAEDYRADSDAMAPLISDLRHYADWRGIDFDEAVTAGNRKCAERRALEQRAPMHRGRSAVRPGRAPAKPRRSHLHLSQ